MKHKISYIIIIIISCLLFSGCASIINGSTQRITIDSNVQGAQILINGKHIGTTPYTGNIHRGSDTSLTIAMEGFRSKTVMLSNTIEPIFFGNLICGGTTGMVIDYSTDAMFRYAPNNIQIDLEQE